MRTFHIYYTLRQCLLDLEAHGDLIRINQEVDANLEIGAIQRRIFRAKGPALLFTRVKNCSFPMAANIFGTRERIRFIFRHSLDKVKNLISLKADPSELLKNPLKFLKAFPSIMHSIPKKVHDGPVLQNQTSIHCLPQLKSWNMDGGAYITLPQVYSESLSHPGWAGANLGMYRVQLSGGNYKQDQEIGLHYQIHRGIGFHHAEALEKGVPFYVNIFIGGPPAMTLAAVMPLPEGLPEIAFAGVMAGHRIPLIIRSGQLPIPAEADFCITGMVAPDNQLPEGPFGDHLGYYSLIHDFPVLKVNKVFHRKDAVWPFTTVGRPPQEDSIIGEFIHELTAPMVSNVFSGIHEVNAVDAAGVHPLLLAIGSERYVPYAKERCPQELLTGALSLLGTTQTSLSKYVLIAAQEDNPQLSTSKIKEFFSHFLERADWSRDLHFITRTTMDTLDYSGISLNQGSKVIMAAAGKSKRSLGTDLPSQLKLPDRFTSPKLCLPGIITIQGPGNKMPRDTHDPEVDLFCKFMEKNNELSKFPLIIISDDSKFTSKNLDNFLWVTFTRSDPSTDIYGLGTFTQCKHWGCTDSLVIDARIRDYHAPILIDDPKIEKRVDALGASNGPLHGII
ncbi:4-hydroxy-3-polyprenylbenzoate decarboxylase [Candidatus Magnetomoraceae bacterium gMMP-1]